LVQTLNPAVRGSGLRVTATRAWDWDGLGWHGKKTECEYKAESGGCSCSCTLCELWVRGLCYSYKLQAMKRVGTSCHLPPDIGEVERVRSSLSGSISRIALDVDERFGTRAILFRSFGWARLGMSTSWVYSVFCPGRKMCWSRRMSSSPEKNN
jgi:hypothetical protein